MAAWQQKAAGTVAGSSLATWLHSSRLPTKQHRAADNKEARVGHTDRQQVQLQITTVADATAAAAGLAAALSANGTKRLDMPLQELCALAAVWRGIEALDVNRTMSSPALTAGTKKTKFVSGAPQTRQPDQMDKRSSCRQAIHNHPLSLTVKEDQKDGRLRSQ